MFPFVLSLALGRILTAQKFCVKMKRNYLLVMLGHINPSQGTQFPGGLIRKPSTFVGRIPKCSPPIALGRPLFQKPVPKMSLFTRSWQALAGNLQRLFINITISLLFKKTVWPLLFWALAHTRPFDMSTLDLVGISKLASLHIKKNKQTNKRDYDVLYCVCYWGCFCRRLLLHMALGYLYLSLGPSHGGINPLKSHGISAFWSCDRIGKLNETCQ